MIYVVVREDYPAESAAPGQLRNDLLEVIVEAGAGIDDPGGVAPEDPRVRAGQREQPGVLGAQAHDPTPGEPLRIG